MKILACQYNKLSNLSVIVKKMAKRFTKSSINWSDIEKRISPEQKGHYFAFKGKSDGYLKRFILIFEIP